MIPQLLKNIDIAAGCMRHINYSAASSSGSERDNPPIESRNTSLACQKYLQRCHIDLDKDDQPLKPHDTSLN